MVTPRWPFRDLSGRPAPVGTLRQQSAVRTDTVDSGAAARLEVVRRHVVEELLELLDLVVAGRRGLLV